MTRVEFFYDPCCPFCWITSRWLLDVSCERDIEVTWRPFSLAMKNEELEGRKNYRPDTGQGHRAGHRALRLVTAAEAVGGSAGALYSALGRAKHIDGREFDDALFAEVLAEAGLPAELAEAADDERFDAALEEQLQAAIDVVGGDVGVPVIVFDGAAGRRGYFGPVLTTLPSREESLAIWDGLSAMAGVSAFCELKRSRPAGGPDTASTRGH